MFLGSQAPQSWGIYKSDTGCCSLAIAPEQALKKKKDKVNGTHKQAALSTWQTIFAKLGCHNKDRVEF